MRHPIRTYAVRHPLLRRSIRFFWEIRGADHMALDHRLIPQRNINLRFNLSETPQYACLNGDETRLEEVFFSGLQDRCTGARLRSSGLAHVLGVCFRPDGFYPFLKLPVSEVKNQLLGADEVGFRPAGQIVERLREAPDTGTRLSILEEELVAWLAVSDPVPDGFRHVFNDLRSGYPPLSIAECCRRNGIGPRRLERMFERYVGVSPAAYGMLDRFHGGINQLISSDYEKLSDIAYRQGYFDQAHFIRDFKRFAGSTPTRFIARNDSMLQVGQMG